jgi:hypothetical protein
MANGVSDARRVVVEVGTVGASITHERIAQLFHPLFRRIDMTIVIEDISTAELLDGQALTAIRGGIACQPAASPWEGCVPQLPAFPSGFPFVGCSPVVNPAPKLELVDPNNPLLQ